jgi:hypothetical protein
VPAFSTDWNDYSLSLPFLTKTKNSKYFYMRVLLVIKNDVGFCDRKLPVASQAGSSPRPKELEACVSNFQLPCINHQITKILTSSN